MSEVVRPSSLAVQPIGEASRVLDGVHQLKLPVPFPLKFVASYLVEGGDGWTVIDPGFDYPPAREVWEAEAARMGLDLDRDVKRIIVTHLHPDHIALARWIQERSGAPVWMLEGEIANARHVWDPARGTGDFVRYMMRNGMDPDTAGATAGTTRLGIRIPERLFALRPGEVIELGDSEARVVHTPGHSDFHFVLHDERRRLLFAGDHLLLHITPNIGLWTYTAPRPLERYLDSIRGLRGMEVDLVFPGHGPLFHDLDGRIDELVLHHEERLSVMHGAFAGEPATAFEIARRVFPDELSDHQLRFALAETLAHLEYLTDDGRAERLDGDVIAYRAI
ncbi:MAG TPA: MBL fold metallo-hydrolase [Rubrobacteraceae bacterium]|nr:MBL fold metallo-hydrolase [Rubrobacteraceae bacterium]